MKEVIEFLQDILVYGSPSSLMVEKYHVHTLNASKADGFAGRNATTLQLDSFLTIARLNHQQLASQAVGHE